MWKDVQVISVFIYIPRWKVYQLKQCFIHQVHVLFAYSTDKSNFFDQLQRQPQSPDKPSLSLVTAHDGSSIIQCPEATGNDNDDVSHF